MTSPAGGGQYQQDVGAPGGPHGPKITSVFDFSAEALEQLAFWLEQRGLHIPVSQLLGYSSAFNYCSLGITTPPSAYTDIGVAHKIPWDNEIKDTQGWHDPSANTKVLPAQAGFFVATCSVVLSDNFDTRDVLQLRLLVNNTTEICKIKTLGGPSTWTGLAVGTFTANGTSDYVEAELTHSVQGNTVNMTLTTGCYMSVVRIGG